MSNPNDALHTSFAPINAAWDAGIQLTGTLTEAQLALAVNAHVVIEGGPYSSFELGNQSSYTLTTVQGQELNIRSDGSKIFVNDVQCLSLDILTSNGIVCTNISHCLSITANLHSAQVHIIEAELIPDDVYNSRGVTRPPRSPASTRLLQTFARTNQRASKVIAAAGTGGGIYDAGPVKPPSG